MYSIWLLLRWKSRKEADFEVFCVNHSLACKYFVFIGVKYSYFMIYYYEYRETLKHINSLLFPVKSVSIHNGSSLYALVTRCVWK